MAGRAVRPAGPPPRRSGRGIRRGRSPAAPRPPASTRRCRRRPVRRGSWPSRGARLRRSSEASRRRGCRRCAKAGRPPAASAAGTGSATSGSVARIGTRCPSPSRSRKASVSGSRRIPSTMIAAVESDSATSGSRTPAEAWNLYSPVSQAKVENTISSTSRRISASSTVRETRPRSTRILPSRARPWLGHRVEGPVQVGVRDAAPPLEEGADPLAFAGGGGRSQLALLEEEVSRLVPVDERQRPLQPLQEDAPQDLRQGRLGKGSAKADRCRLCGHGIAVSPARVAESEESRVSAYRHDHGLVPGGRKERRRGGQAAFRGLAVRITSPEHAEAGLALGRTSSRPTSCRRAGRAPNASVSEGISQASSSCTVKRAFGSELALFSS